MVKAGRTCGCGISSAFVTNPPSFPPLSRRTSVVFVVGGTTVPSMESRSKVFGVSVGAG